MNIAINSSSTSLRFIALNIVAPAGLMTAASAELEP